MILLAASLAATPSPAEARRELRDAMPAEPVPAASEDLQGYIALALAAHPAVRAAFARWEAAVHRIARAAALPEPTVQLGTFVRSVETRVGPQQARISVQQAFPWPSRPARAGDAAAAEAEAARLDLEATALALAAEVEVADWNLWELRATRELHAEHLVVLDSLAATARGRLEVGAADLARLQQLELARARLDDSIATLTSRIAAAEVALRTLVPGAPDTLPTPDEPVLVEPDALPADLQAHPAARAAAARAGASLAAERTAAADRLPSFTVGADWILTGATGTMPDAGKDAVVAGVGVRVPLWQGAHAETLDAQRAETRAREADVERRLLDLERAAATERLAALDAARRVRTLEATLLPVAEAAFEALLGELAAGTGGVADVLLAQRDLLDLRVDLVRARADHVRALARLAVAIGSPP
ncbi:MAG: TolC family protein [Alphaproteobacteria bacterium]|nr:TolC family protein [Alphaproteobacteria bacterium]